MAADDTDQPDLESVDTDPFHLDADWASTDEWRAANPTGTFRPPVSPKDAVKDDPELAESIAGARARNARRKQRLAGLNTFQRWLEKGRDRLTFAWVFILQGSIAAGLAYWISEGIFNHFQPFFAPIAALVTLGTQGGARFRRGWELVFGVAIGVVIGDIVVHFIGMGIWQLVVIVLISMSVSIFADRGPIVPIQAASSAVLVAILAQPGTGLDRMVDAFIGGIVGLTVISLIPNSPVKDARKSIASLLHKASKNLVLVSKGLALGDRSYVSEALENARGTQGTINSMKTQAAGSSEVAILSPLYWSSRQEINSLNRILLPVDNIMRNTRVLARRAGIMLDDNIQSPPELTKLIFDLSEVLEYMGDVYDSPDRKFEQVEAESTSEIVHALRLLGGRAQMRLAEGTGLSGAVILAECRSIIVDALQVCGLSVASARAVLYPTTVNPAFPPELWNEENSPEDHDPQSQDPTIQDSEDNPPRA